MEGLNELLSEFQIDNLKVKEGPSAVFLEFFFEPPDFDIGRFVDRITKITKVAIYLKRPGDEKFQAINSFKPVPKPAFGGMSRFEFIRYVETLAKIKRRRNGL